MTLDRIVMDEEYGKLLMARDNIWARLGAAIEEGENFETSIVFILARLLVDQNTVSLPVMDAEQAEIAGKYVNKFLASKNNMISMVLNERDLRQLLEIAETNRISDDWNRQIALRFADVVKDLFPAFHIVKEQLTRIMK